MATRIGDAGVLLSVPARPARRAPARLDLEEREQVSAQWLRLAEQAEDRDSAALALAWRSYDLLRVGRDRARAAARRAPNALAADLRQPLYGSFATTWNFVFSELEGDLEAAEDHAREGHKLATRAGGTYANSLYGGQLFGLHRDRGQLGELRRWSSRSSSRGSRPGGPAISRSRSRRVTTSGRARSSTRSPPIASRRSGATGSGSPRRA